MENEMRVQPTGNFPWQVSLDAMVVSQNTSEQQSTHRFGVVSGQPTQRAAYWEYRLPH